MGTRPVFGVLGPLEVWLDGALVRVGGPRQRALLGLLLCHANRVVSRDQLIEELLGDQPAATADRMLRVQVSRLRKALGDVNGSGQPRLQARPPGYLLHVADGELDLHVFEQQVAAGRQALADGNPGRAAELLREAESLWRQPAPGRSGVRAVRGAGGAPPRDAPDPGRRGPDRYRARPRASRRRVPRARAARHRASDARAASRAADDRPLPVRSPGGRAARPTRRGGRCWSRSWPSNRARSCASSSWRCSSRTRPWTCPRPPRARTPGRPCRPRTSPRTLRRINRAPRRTSPPLPAWPGDDAAPPAPPPDPPDHAGARDSRRAGRTRPRAAVPPRERRPRR